MLWGPPRFIGTHRELLGATGNHWDHCALGHTGTYWNLVGLAGTYWDVLKPIENHWNSLGLAGIYLDH